LYTTYKSNNFNICVQDDYNLEEDDKWCSIFGFETTLLHLTTLSNTENTETYYLNIFYGDKCIHSSGILDFPITLDKCD